MNVARRYLVIIGLLFSFTTGSGSARERMEPAVEPIGLDSSINQFTNLTIGAAGYLTGGGGDIFVMSGNFTNGSTQNFLWPTAASELQFKGGTFHTFAMAGADLGPAYFGYVNNFSFDTLRLGAGQGLGLAEGNATPGSAIYVNNLVLEGGLPHISSITGNDSFIYYDPTKVANMYLNAQTYPLAGWRGDSTSHRDALRHFDDEAGQRPHSTHVPRGAESREHDSGHAGFAPAVCRDWDRVGGCEREFYLR